MLMTPESTLKDLGYLDDEPSEFDTGMIAKIKKAVRKKLNDLDDEDLRLLVSQGFGLPVTVPLALDILERDYLATGMADRGALLMALLRSDHHFWQENDALLWRLKEIVSGAYYEMQLVLEDVTIWRRIYQTEEDT